jgi:NADH:ubiquinone oxidoreductase subunit 6 (subunit J)
VRRVEDRRIDGRACIAAGCAVLSPLVVATTLVGIYFGAVGSIFATSCLVDYPAGPRARRVALVAGLISLFVLVAGLIVLLTRPKGDVYHGP